MGRLTLRLPESLHHELESQAERESVSLNQYLVYALTRHVSMAYTVREMPEAAIEQQRAAFAGLLESLGQASPSEIQKTLAARERVELEPGLPLNVAARLHQRIATALTTT
jgi:hypothetical protein